MTSYKMGLFTIYDPPDVVDGHPEVSAQDWVDVVIDAYKTTDYPWHRLIPGMSSNNFAEIRIEFSTNLPAGSVALYESSVGRITIGTQYGLSGVPFSVVHEIGHCVDHLTFSWEIQQEIMAYWHDMQCYYHNKIDPNGSGPYIWSHEYPHLEQWVAWGNVNYAHRHNEAYADAFVAAFNPTWWGSRGANTRFSHWPVEFDKNPPITHYDHIRYLTLKEPIMVFTDVPDSHPHYPGIMWAAANNIVGGYPDNTFKPDVKVTDAAGNPRSDIKVSGIITRGQFCTVLKKYHDAVEAGVL